MAIMVPRNVLVVESDMEKCAKLIVMVKKFEHNLFVAPTEAHFDRFISTITFHCVILSAKMPSAGGVSYLDRIAAGQSSHSVGVILTGDKGDEKTLADAVKSGKAVAYGIWPISASALFLPVERIIGVSKRQSPRIRVLFKVQVAALREVKSFVATSFSETGVFIRTNAPYPVGTPLKMALDLPTAKPLELDGEVVRAALPGKAHLMEPGMGVKFTNIEGPIQLGLRTFIESLLTVEMGDEVH